MKLTRFRFQGIQLILAQLFACASVGCITRDQDSHDRTGTKTDLPEPAPEDGFQLHVQAVANGREEIHRCFVTEIPIEGPVAIGRAELVQQMGVHHMTVTIPLTVGLSFENGEYACKQLYAENPKLMDATTLFASQKSYADMRFPSDVGVTLPGRIQVLVELHYVNVTDQQVPVWSKLNAYFMPIENVKRQLDGFAKRDLNVNIPARAEQHDEWTRCRLSHDIDILFLSMHSHGRSMSTSIRDVSDNEPGQLLYENEDWHAPEVKDFTSSPRRMNRGSLLEFRCSYRNADDRDVHWGLTADDEMCNLAMVFVAAHRDEATVDGTTRPLNGGTEVLVSEPVTCVTEATSDGRIVETIDQQANP